MDRFIERTRHWLTLRPEQVEHCVADDNAFDALIAALVARAATVNEVLDIPSDQMATARREGWIALPKDGSLERLVP